MSTHTEIPSDSPCITMTRFYPAPRALVWRTLTEPEHVRRWWGGAACTNPVCEMDVRPGGRWRHMMRLRNSPELRLELEFVEVEPPSRLVWQPAREAATGEARDGLSLARIEISLEELGADTRWTLVARFDSMAEREAAMLSGFTSPLAAGAELLGPYLDQLGGRVARFSMRPSAAPRLSGSAARPDSASAATLHAFCVGSFIPMLESLREWLERGAQHTGGGGELPGARLAPDMYTLAQQVQLACHHARDAVARLSGMTPGPAPNVQADLKGMHDQIADSLALLRSALPAAFAGAGERDCSIPTPDGRVIRMDGLTFLRAWALPNFYFHAVTAYDILRHSGVPLGKKDYLSQLASLIQ